MKVYRIRTDANNFQSFYPIDEKIWDTNLLIFDGASRKKDWIPLEVYVLQTKLKRGNFFKLCPGSLVVDKYAIDSLASFFEMSGELLPIFFDNTEYNILNVTECVNVLNQENTNWVNGQSTGKKIRIEKYSFLPERFVEVPLFKIPETCKSEILTITGIKDPDYEFKTKVEKLGLQGLIFEEIWSYSHE